MKKLFILILTVLIIISASSCTGEKTENKISGNTAFSETQAVTKSAKSAVYGIDISSFNGIIDWKKVKNDNISFAMIRIGGRGYGDEGSIYTDKTALLNLESSSNQNIDTGVYFFSQATSVKEAVLEADHIKKTLNGRSLKLPVAYDVERIKGDKSRIDNVKYKDSVKYAKVFLNKIKSYGYEPMVYIGEDSILKAEDFKEYKIWFANYGKAYDSGYEILQYSKKGKVDGITADVDLDVIYN